MSTRRLLSIFVVVAVFLRLGSLWFTLEHVGPGNLQYGDAQGYIMLAESLASGHGFSSEVNGEYVPQVFRAPGVSFLLAPFVTWEEGLIVYYVLLSILAGILLPLLMYGIGKKLFGEGAAIIAAAFVVLEPNFIFYSFLPISEMPFMLFMLGGCYLALLSMEIKKTHYALLTIFSSGLLLGYTLLIRPPFLLVYIVAFLTLAGWSLFRRDFSKLTQVGALILGVVIVLTPWVMRNHTVTGSYALSGMGWRNIYTDYLGSVRALDNGTSFDVEKKELIDSARAAGIEPGNPASANALREITIPELWERRGTVLKLETFLIASFFMHDGYFYTFRRFGFIPDDKIGVGRSVSFALLSKGVDGVPAVFEELKRQYFIPIVGRLFTIGTALLALIGAWFMRRNPWTYLLLLIIGLTALISTAIGFGVEARMRFPVAPFIFLLAGVTITRLYSWYERRYLHPRV